MSLIDQFGLDGQTAVVTGAGRGLGREMAAGLAEAGADVAIAEVEPDAVPTDVTDESEVEAMVEHVTDRLGPVDVLVNNAGVVSNVPAEDLSLSEWQRVIDVNLTGVFLCAKHAGRQMLDRGADGSIVNVSSMSGFIANYPQPQVHYNASKAGVAMVTRSLASEWATEGIRVNAIAPGYMGTDMVEQALEANPEMEETWLADTPMKRLGRPEELRGVVVFLASGASSFVTGEVVFVDGGFTIR
ncbi:short-chain dehydrogenase [Halobacteriales archaeon QS_1_68_17]|nr:MAG: short-chain dehydrogenase [Halobacteriales archaeon QS_1_68_17]